MPVRVILYGTRSSLVRVYRTPNPYCSPSGGSNGSVDPAFEYIMRCSTICTSMSIHFLWHISRIAWWVIWIFCKKVKWIYGHFLRTVTEIINFDFGLPKTFFSLLYSNTSQSKNYIILIGRAESFRFT